MHTKTITLKSGGTLTVSGEFNAFELNEYDRQYLEGLSDYIRLYGDKLPEIGDR
jgi:hypothetical protein